MNRPGLYTAYLIRIDAFIPANYPMEVRDRATRMAMECHDNYTSVWATAQTFARKLNVGGEAFWKLFLQA